MRSLFFLLPLLLLAIACSDDAATGLTDIYPGDIKVRLHNSGTISTEGMELTFYVSRGTPRDYGDVATGETTDYLSFEEAGRCDIFLEYNCPEGENCATFQSLCLCLCPIEPGNYTLSFELIEREGQIVFNQVSVEED